jgi:hypothetical protein
MASKWQRVTHFGAELNAAILARPARRKYLLDKHDAHTNRDIGELSRMSCVAYRLQKGRRVRYGIRCGRDDDLKDVLPLSARGRLLRVAVCQKWFRRKSDRAAARGGLLLVLHNTCP